MPDDKPTVQYIAKLAQEFGYTDVLSDLDSKIAIMNQANGMLGKE